MNQEQSYYGLSAETDQKGIAKGSMRHMVGLPMGQSTRLTRTYAER